MNKLLPIIIVITIALNGCTDYKPYSKTHNHQPFPSTNITITESYQWDHNRTVGDLKNPSCKVVISHTDKTSVRLEFWKQNYRARDSLVKACDLDKPDTTEIEFMDPKTHYHTYTPFYRIECYATIDGKLKHQTIKYRFQSHYDND